MKEEEDGNDHTDSSSDDDDDSYNDGDESGDDSDSELGGNSVAQGQNGQKIRRPPAQTAREFFQRKQDEEDHQRTKTGGKGTKRPQISHGGSSKKRKSGASGDVNVVTQLERDVEAGCNERKEILECAPAISATTLSKQYQKMRASIPEGCDVRRAKTQVHDLKKAQECFGHKKVSARDGKFLVKAMKTALYDYQLTAAGWMLERELGKSRPLGGIIADEMGMGKTLMSLACIVGNPPSDPEKGCRATLVIVPNILVAEQWKGEATKHLQKKFSDWTDIFHGRHSQNTAQIGHHWIIIATMSQVRRQFAAVEKGHPENPESTEDIAKTLKGSEKAPLFNTKWYRIILDEAHSIKNIHSLSGYFPYTRLTVVN